MAGEPAEGDAVAESPSAKRLSVRSLTWVGTIVTALIVATAVSFGTGLGQDLFRKAFSSHPSDDSPLITIAPLTTYAVSGKEGFVAGGSASSLGADTIWLFDYVGGAYYIDVQAIVDPNKRTWSAPDRHLGSGSEKLPFSLTAVVVVADAQCTSILQTSFNSGNTNMPSLPSGCHAIQPPIRVTVYKE
jgi:hypothetical protein